MAKLRVDLDSLTAMARTVANEMGVPHTESLFFNDLFAGMQQAVDDDSTDLFNTFFRYTNASLRRAALQAQSISAGQLSDFMRQRIDDAIEREKALKRSLNRQRTALRQLKSQQGGG